ncbi:hybrid sensor histidine kinase/response regulator transcription factor [Mucilaginibacter paludis]|uniref:histidine kinase n=1 Tax=Mucilaginibacter paludis DSM 18603 TaxID=714943 RepID=H1Y5H4_9SPHI|nr:two-component regulator propeller domain-containing protein [Mucilaginibacter paludis]EHQ29326.1 histidine kinase [Mucilaginibacter paludis DSM 18603]
MRKNLILICLIFTFCNTSFGQISFDHLSVANGLSQSTVLSIFKDSRGYMWFGTRDRLNRYDARHIKVYNYDYQDSTSISCSDYIFSVFEDREKNLWIGTVKGLNKYLPESDSFQRILNNPANSNSLSGNSIYCIYQDSRGNRWFGSNNGLNMLPAGGSQKFTRFFKSSRTQPGLAGNEVYVVYEDRSKNLWIGTTEGLSRMTFKNGGYTFTSFTSSPSNPQGLDGNFVKTITEDQHGNLWIGTETGGLNLFNPQTSTFSHFKHDPFNNNSLSNNDVRKIMPDKKGKLWIGTMNGLNIFDPGTKQFTHYDHDVENRNSLSDNSIKDIYLDNNGTIWIGTMFGGVNVIQPNSIPFTVYQSNKFKNSISSNIVSAIVADSKQNLWIGTEGNGLNYFDKAKGTFKHYINHPGDAGSIGTNFIKALYRDKENNLWVGLHQGGLDLLMPSGDSFKHYRHNADDPNSISSDIVSCMLEDSSNRFWIGTSMGMVIFDKSKQQFCKYISNPANPLHLSSRGIRCIYEDSRHNIWAGTTGGLNVLKAGASSFFWFKANELDSNSLRVGYINCIKEDSRGNIWIGSFHGGLSRFMAKSQTFKTYTTQNGMPSDNVLNIQQGDDGYLWVSTDNGLAKFNINTGKVKVYTVKDGLPTNEFNYNSSFKDAAGNLYFGTYNGLVNFSPKQIKENGIAPPVLFTGLKLFNRPVNIMDKTNLLTKDISLTNQIIFTHDQNVFSLDFTALNYDKPDRNHYMYKLEGFEKDWNYVSNPTATYTNLPAGDYNFLVRGSNNDGLWSKNVKSLHIKILPPLWKTWWAYVFYVSAFLLILYLVIRFFRRQARLERDLYYEHLNYERQQEVYQLKLDFFTKISHEIRTPLTLILAPVEKLIDLTLDHGVISRQLVYVKQNADRLIRLVNELLDFRKVETGHMKLYVSEHDMVKFCYDIYMSFERLSVAQNMTYRFECDSQGIPAYFDGPQFEKVLFNILSNAFKFTPDNGSITLSVFSGADTIDILITDNGIGISDEAQQHIFENFYQDKHSSKSSGWGIGLALAKNIIELHQGTISVNSTAATADHSGSTSFKVSVLKGKTHFSDDELVDEIIQEPSSYQPYYPEPVLNEELLKEGDIEKPVILLIEDNEEVRGFVKEALSNSYEIHESVNGHEGWETATRLIPDLIISDVTMPVMDGLELCSKIKTDDRTNHIPVILLTAKAAHTHQVSGLETGADAYITKPFSMQILELNIRNLLQARQAMRQKYAQQVTLMPKNKVIDSPDEQFLTKLMDIVERNMEDPDFDVVKLVKEIGMSQTVLYRKIKALTDLTITDFIKSARLKQAALLLSQNKLTIAGVAYAVGFNDRKYFSKEFKKQFGKAPSEYVEQNSASTF